MGYEGILSNKAITTIIIRIKKIDKKNVNNNKNNKNDNSNKNGNNKKKQ